MGNSLEICRKSKKITGSEEITYFTAFLLILGSPGHPKIQKNHGKMTTRKQAKKIPIQPRPDLDPPAPIFPSKYAKFAIIDPPLPQTPSPNGLATPERAAHSASRNLESKKREAQ